VAALLGDRQPTREELLAAPRARLVRFHLSD
jgi:hypothetical protein